MVHQQPPARKNPYATIARCTVARDNVAYLLNSRIKRLDPETGIALAWAINDVGQVLARTISDIWKQKA